MIDWDKRYSEAGYNSSGAKFIQGGKYYRNDGQEVENPLVGEFRVKKILERVDRIRTQYPASMFGSTAEEVEEVSLNLIADGTDWAEEFKDSAERAVDNAVAQLNDLAEFKKTPQKRTRKATK